MGLLGSLLFAATPALAQTPIAADYTTSVSGNFTSGDWEVKYPVTVFVDTDGGINGGTFLFDGSTLTISASNGLKSGTLDFTASNDSFTPAYLEANTSHAITGGTVNLSGAAVGRTTLYARASDAISGGVQNITGLAELRVEASHGISGGTQTFGVSGGLSSTAGVLIAEATNSISGGTQTFYTGTLEIRALDAIGAGTTQTFQAGANLKIIGGGSLSAGTQNFTGLSVSPNISGSNVAGITGGTQNFYAGAKSSVSISGGTQNYFSSRATFASTAQLSGGTQNFTNSLLILGGYFSNSSITGGTQNFYGYSTLDVVEDLEAPTTLPIVTGGNQNFYDHSYLRVEALNALAGANITLHDESYTSIQRSDGSNVFGTGTNITFDASGGGTGGTLYLASHSTVGRISSVANGGVITNNSDGIGAGSLTVQFDSVTSTYGGLLVNGEYDQISFEKAGTGTLVLTGNNTYTGSTTVTGGTLVVNGSLANTAVSVADGATLGGSGTIGGLVTFADGATLAPGNSPGTMTFTNGLTLNDGAILDFQLGSPGGIAGVDSDLIVVSGGTLSGSASANGITLNLSDLGDFGAGTYDLIRYSGATTDSFDAGDFHVGTGISGYTYTFGFNFAGDTLQLTATSAVPEPATYAALLGALVLGLASWRRRRT